MKRIVLVVVLLCSIIISNNLFSQNGNVGIGTSTPTHPFTVDPSLAGSGLDPVRFIGLNPRGTENAILVVDPVASADGVVRYMYMTDFIDSVAYTAVRDSLLNDSAFIVQLATDSVFIASVSGDSSFVDSLMNNHYFTSSTFTVVRDSLIIDGLFLDSIYSFTSDSLLVDTGWISALKNLIDSDVDTLILYGSDLVVVEDGDSNWVDLAGLALDSSFANNLLSNSYFTDSLFTLYRDSLILDQRFNDSLYSMVRDSLLLDSIFVSTLASDSSFVDSLLANGYFMDSIYTFVGDSLLLDTAWLNALKDSIDSDVDTLILNGSDVMVVEDGDTNTVNLAALALDSAFADSLLSNSYYTDSLFTVYRDSLILDQRFNDSIYNTVRDSLLLDSIFVGTLTSDSSFVDSLLSNGYFTDSIYTLVSDSLLLDTAWLNALKDSIDSDVDTILLNGSDLSVVEDGDTNTVNLAALALDSAFADSLLSNFYYTDSLFTVYRDSLILDQIFNDSIYNTVRDSLLLDSIFVGTLTSDSSFVDSLLSNGYFTDSIYTLVSDSLLLDTAWLNALKDSIDTDVDTLILNGSDVMVVEDGDTNAVNLAALALDSAFADSLLSNSYYSDSLFTVYRDSLILDQRFNDSIYVNVSDSLLMDTNFITSLASDSLFTTTLAMDSNFINTLTSDSLFITTLASDSSFVDSLINNSRFTDSMYVSISDSLLLDTAWLNALKDSIDTDVDTILLNGSDLSVVEDGDTNTVNLAALALDSAFADSLFSNSYYSDSLFTVYRDSLILDQRFNDSIYNTVRDSLLLDSIFVGTLTSDSSFVDSLLSNSYFTDSIYTITRDSLLGDTYFTDSIYTITRDSLLGDTYFTDSIYSITSDSLLNDIAWLTELKDSIDSDVDTIYVDPSKADTLTIVEDGDTINTPLYKSTVEYAIINSSGFVVTRNISTIFVNPVANMTIELPDATLNAGRIIYIKRTDNAGSGFTVDIIDAGGNNVEDAVSQSLNIGYQKDTYQSDGSNWWLISQ